MAKSMSRYQYALAISVGRKFCLATLNERQDYAVNLGYKGATMPIREVTFEPHLHGRVKHDIDIAKRYVERYKANQTERKEN